SVQAARPDAFGNNIAPGDVRRRALTAALGHAVESVMAMQTAGFRTETMGNANVAGTVFDLAVAGRATPQRVQAVRVAAEARGLDVFSNSDCLDAEVLLAGGQSFNEARGSLVYNQTLRDLTTGGAPGGVATPAHTAALATPTRGLFSGQVVQRVQD